MASTPTSVLSTLQNNQSAVAWQQLLSDILTAYDCSTGTIHVLDKKTNLLSLVAHEHIPPFLMPRMLDIPIGKGMAGIAAERKEPVEMCNLQTDESGVAKPAAKETKVEGSIAVPMLLDGELHGVIGIGKTVPYDFTEEETKELMQIGVEMSRHIRASESQGNA